MNKILIVGAGNIGSLIGCLLAQADYHVYFADIKEPKFNVENALNNLNWVQLDVTKADKLEDFCKKNKITTLVSCLPYYLNVKIADVAKKLSLNYFDTTEDIEVAEAIKKIAANAKNVFMPRCGLAPGYINILGNDLMQDFEELETADLRAGDIPININNALQYALSWSTDGLINEYGNPCQGIVEGHKVTLEPLEDLEVVEIDGRTYEAFNTSGGVGSLVDTYKGKIRNLNYKTLRYPGHREKMRFLMKDLRLNEDRATLKRILENVLPKTVQDVVLVYIAVTGRKQGQLLNKTYANKIYPQQVLNHPWTAIQTTTASGLCAVLDIVLNNLNHYHGFVLQEQISLKEFLANRFGKIFAK